MYAASAPVRVGAQVERSVQSKGWAAEREARRTGRSRAASLSATRRPVLPVAPITRNVMSQVSQQGVRLSMVEKRNSMCDRLIHGSACGSAGRASGPWRFSAPFGAGAALVAADPGRGSADGGGAGARQRLGG